MTSIRYCELYDPEILEAKRGLEERDDVHFFPLIYSAKHFENTYNRSHEWAKVIAIQRVLPLYIDRVLYVDDIRTFHQNQEIFDRSRIEFLSRWWKLGEMYKHIDEALYNVGKKVEDTRIRPYVEKPIDGEEIDVKDELTIRVSLPRKIFVSIPTSSSLRVRIVFDGLKFETLLHCITHSYD